MRRVRGTWCPPPQSLAARVCLRAETRAQRQCPANLWRAKPSTYVVCADDMAVHPDLQRIMARRCGTVLEWPTDHSPFLSRPDLVAGLLVELAFVAD
ncbi:MAG: alpha/beta fold hydrolase [Acidimicrobiales bacterium]